MLGKLKKRIVNFMKKPIVQKIGFTISILLTGIICFKIFKRNVIKREITVYNSGYNLAVALVRDGFDITNSKVINSTHNDILSAYTGGY